MGFYILPRADDKEASTYQEKRYVQKKERKVSVKKYNAPHHGLGGSRHEKRKEELLRTNHTKQYSKGQYMRQICLHF
jgi:hypothetical protein